MVEEVSENDAMVSSVSSNTVWAFAKAGIQSEKVFNSLEEQIIQKCRDFNTQNLSNTVWAFATAGEGHPQLFNKLAEEA